MPLDFNSFLPHELISIGGVALLLWVIGGVIFNLYRWRDVVGSYSNGTSKASRSSSFIGALSKTISQDVLIQRDILNCNLQRWFSHFSTFWGFILLGVSTTLNYLMNPKALPLAIAHPVRIIGNIGGLLFIAGLTVMIYRRLASESVRRNSTFGDNFFIALLYVVGASGFLTEIFSDLGLFSITSAVYWVHMLSIVALIATAPFTKFIHALGRPLLHLLDNYDETRTDRHEP